MDSISIYRLLITYPVFDIYDAAGNYTTAIPLNGSRANPIGMMDYEHGQNETKTYGLHANAYLVLQPIKNLKFRSSFGVRYLQNNYRKFAPVYNLSSDNFRNENEVQQQMTTRMNWMIENTINYTFSAGRNNFDILLGQSVENNGLGMSMNGSNKHSLFNDFEHAYLDNTKVILAGSTTLGGAPINTHKMASFFGRVNFDYNEKYMLTFVMRADGSSNFKRGKRWGYFPSLSAAWRLDQEAFMENIVSKGLNNLKLRVSYGSLGNKSIGNYDAISLYGKTVYVFNNKPAIGMAQSAISNASVTWESTYVTDIGLDFGLFNNRL